MSRTSAAKERDLRALARKKLEIKRQLWSLTHDGTVAAVEETPLEEDSVNGARVEGNPQGEAMAGGSGTDRRHLEPPTFQLNGRVNTAASLINRTSAPQQFHSTPAVDRQREDLLLQLEELELDEQEMAAEQVEEYETADDRQHRYTPDAPRVQEWVQSQVRPAHQSRASNVQPTHGVSLLSASMSQEQATRRTGGMSKLPKFSGEIKDWVAFEARFRETTELYGVSEAENLYRLQEALIGEAANLVRGLLFFPEQVETAMAKLRSLYGTPSRLMADAEETIAKLAPLDDALSNLASFSSSVSYVIAVMRSANEPRENLTLLRALQQKLSPVLRMQWGKRKMKDGSSLDTMEAFLNDMLNIAVDVNLNVHAPSTSHPPGMSNEKSTKPRASPSPRPPAPQPHSLSCQFGCSSLHAWHLCTLFCSMSVEARREAVKQSSRCVKCLGLHLPQRRCHFRTTCKELGCEDQRHTLLHSHVAFSESVGALHSTNATGVYFRILPIKVENDEKTIDTYAIIDTGSTSSFIERDLAQELQAEGPQRNLRLSYLGKSGEEVTTRQLSLNVRDTSGELQPLACHEIETLGMPSQSVSAEELATLNLNVNVPILKNVRPRILIGMNNGHLTRTIDVRRTSLDGVGAVLSVLGWALEGNRDAKGRPASERVRSTDDTLSEAVREYMDREAFGLDPVKTVPTSQEDQRALQLLNTRTRRVGGRFETGLLWKEGNHKFPDTKRMAVKRLESFERKLAQDPNTAEKVRELIRQYVQKGYAQPIVDCTPDPQAWYLPIFLIKNPQKPEKVRIVWDAAAKVSGTSLNDLLLSGPDLGEPLVLVLQRFRRGPVAVIGDICEMFHQIRIREKDQKAQRFLWRDDSGKIGTMELLVVSFGATCSPTTAQYVKNYNAEEHRHSHPEAAQSIIKNTYVDDWLYSGWSLQEVIERTEEVIEVNRGAGFEMAKWCSNAREVTQALGMSETVNNLNRLTENKVLGMKWRIEEDSFRFELDHESVEQLLVRAPTKREILRFVMKIFDPLGLVSHMTISPRLLIRELWRREIDWDDPLPSDLHSTWTKWLTAIPAVEALRFPRWYGTTSDPVALHIFCDAGERAMAAVAYVVQTRGNTTCSRLALSKCLVARLRAQSIPRQELDAAVLGIRVLQLVREGMDLPISNTYLWTDAHDVLHWINSKDRRYKPYVMTRVNTILRETSKQQWNWVPSASNPADWATKDEHALEDVSLWNEGPKFIRQPCTTWPSWQPTTKSTDPEEVRVLKITEPVHNLSDRAQHVRSWRILVRSVARAFSFVRLLLARRRGTEYQLREPTAEAEAEAEGHIIRAAQRDLEDRDLKGLSPAKDADGFIRMSSRLARASALPYGMKHPVVLPSKHPVTQLIFQDAHCRMGHQSTMHTLTELRRKGYVCKRMRNTLNGVIRQCRTCRLIRARPCQPEMGLLPAPRVSTRVRPFTFTGVDYFGPVEVTVGRRREKRWGVLFTCLTVRAVYLDSVSSLSAVAFCRTLDNLANRHTLPRQIWCDNATNFTAASHQYAFRDGRRPHWRFIPPGSPHMGGSWERLVGSVKRAMERVEIPQPYSDEDWRHLLVAAEGLLNSRPLTEFPSDSLDALPLTPNDIIHGFPAEPHPYSTATRSEVTQTTLDRERGVAEFWRRWVDEYLPTIAIRKKWQRKAEPLHPGDFVLIAERNLREGWRRGIVDEVVVDPLTKQVREVEVRVADGRIFRRSAHQVAKIDLQ